MTVPLETRQRDVAVVGTGMAGLVTAYLLHHDVQRRFRVRLIDKNPDVSLSAESIAVPATKSEPNAPASWIDVPMRAFAGGFYHNLVRMYDYLGVNYHSQPFLFSFARTAQPRPYMVHASNFHQIPPIPRGGDLVHWLVEVVYVLLCYLYFTLCCFFVAPRHGKSGDVESLDQYLRRIHLPTYYVSHYVLPLISSVCTCTHPQLLAFPASDVLAYKRLTHGQPHFVVTDGVRSVQDKLLRGLDVRLGVQSTRVTPTPDGGVLLTTRRAGHTETDPMTTERFDLVVLAVPPDVAASLFEPVRSVLQEVPTTTVETAAHTDFGPVGAEPGRKHHPRGQHIYLRSNDLLTEAAHLQPTPVHPILVTTNPLTPIDPEKIVRAAAFTRVLRSPRSRRRLQELFREAPSGSAPRTLDWRNGDGGVYLAGGWCWDGMVLLEGCVVSAMRVAGSLGVEVPWRV
ncbi:hypothetical protein BDV59DRAFT_205023 [Aspergillus ambiguus]|uniref:uncharacterized protein n=1 Tax=Aspergillus ambiguus TaxID=176160 RepID=UPI003CCDD39B